MRTMTVNVYKFDELTEEAQERAIERFIEGADYPWWNDSLKSVQEFCDYFGVLKLDYSIGPNQHSYISADYNNNHFRGLKLKDIDYDYMPTGYCLDCTLWQTFHKVWKNTGSALKAFEAALDAACDDIVKDWEYCTSSDYAKEMLEINEYEFDEFGNWI